MYIKVVKQALQFNEDCSKEIRKKLKEKSVYLINVMGSPGTGKTSLIIELIKKLKDQYKVAVVEGDIAGKIDAEKIDSLGIPVVQLNTEGACHIEAASIKNILEYFDLDDLDIIFIENVGNLVCPAEFDIGENMKIAVLSIPEGDDKVEKYPLLFSLADAVILSKFDMMRYFEFNDTKIELDVKGINEATRIFRMSSRTGEGISSIVTYLKEKIEAKI
ncbi:hydrogenase nickel incorporation protein HypB [Clostridium oryzae]|uniref:Hydrogenase isoenzymes nickel incorporation protein HypB n=1 Tax=Clostridium oryzae TaxID=1450648 RepID=A0A1V4IE23_9CLOT|nr:hydrogenase nickel incorporation protein HypB [Clostridium oryzae]OPJ57797.1 hydrogenase isoenzymes nickel incorporation protein HypB [Clostridium oryzae]